MDNREILERAIKRAADNGWQPFEFGKPTEITSWDDEGMVKIAVVFPLHNEPVCWVRELEGIIFNHDFAKALWGEERIEAWGGKIRKIEKDDNVIGTPAWLFHLQFMVIAADPVKYLGENI